MEQSPSWEFNRFSASQEIPHILWNLKVHYCIPNCPGLSWATSIQSMPPHPTSWESTVMLSSHLCLHLPSGLFPSSFPTIFLYTPLHSPICTTCPAHPILLDLIIRIIFGEQYRSLSSSTCSLLYSPVTQSLLYPHILLSTLPQTIKPHDAQTTDHYLNGYSSLAPWTRSHGNSSKSQ